MSAAGIDFSRWSPEVVATLVYVIDRDRMLLIRKKRGHGQGKVNGPGGKVEPGETPLGCALRECEEETGITPLALEPMIELRFQDSEDVPMLGLAFRALRFSGTPRETAEAAPFWCPLTAIPYERMWADDRIWLPRLIEGEPSLGEFIMAGERVIDHRLQPVSRGYLHRLASVPVT
jgi:8-oxo-dGTP diphosphatase